MKTANMTGKGIEMICPRGVLRIVVPTWAVEGQMEMIGQMDDQGWVLESTGPPDKDLFFGGSPSFGWKQLTFKPGSAGAATVPVLFPTSDGWNLTREQ